jgi:predicted N-acetyltransferase YhbS
MRDGVGIATGEHAAPLSRFFRVTWDPSSSEEEVERALALRAESNYVEPGRPPPAFIFAREGEVVGYLSSIPARFRVRGDDRLGHWLQGLSVLPQHRNGPVGFHLVRAATETLGFLAALVVAPPARRLFEAVGFRDVAASPAFVWPLRGFRFGQRLSPGTMAGEVGVPWSRPILSVARRFGLTGVAGAAVRTALAARRALRPERGSGRTVPLRQGWSSWEPAGADSIWNRRARPSHNGLVRDAEYLGWRYGSRPDEYLPLAAGPSESPLATAVIRLPARVPEGRFAGLELAWLTELLVDPNYAESSAAALALVREVERVTAAAGGDLLVSSFSAPAEAQVLARSGHLRTRGGMHLLVRDPEGDPAPGGVRGEEWSVARGDAFSDATA